ncbi:hypothetical protein CEXT_222681, partial [Caerostris extrusa]
HVRQPVFDSTELYQSACRGLQKRRVMMNKTMSRLFTLPDCLICLSDKLPSPFLSQLTSLPPPAKYRKSKSCLISLSDKLPSPFLNQFTSLPPPAAAKDKTKRSFPPADGVHLLEGAPTIISATRRIRAPFFHCPDNDVLSRPNLLLPGLSSELSRFACCRGG